MLDERSDLRRYLAAVGAVGVALALTLMGRSFLEPTPFVLLLVAVLATAWFGGLGPGILASILSLTCFILFFEGRDGAPQLDAPYLRRLIVFLLATLLLGAQSNSSRRARADLRFLSDAGKSLASSLEHDDTIKTICRVFVPNLADACLIELFADDGKLRPVGVGQANDEVGKRLRFLVERRGLARAAGGAERVARTGQPEHYPRVTAEVLRDLVPDSASREAVLGTGVRSLLIIPLRLRDRMIGTITLFACHRRHKFGSAERDLIEELAGRAAVAIDHANHYRAARRMEDELRQRAEELVAADRHKDEFLAVLAHELRGPLSALRTAVEILRGRMPDTLPGGTDPIVMARQIETLGSLVDDLLDVTRIAQGKMSLKKRALNLNEVLAQAMATARPLIDSRGHTLSVGLPVEGILIEGDPVRLGQVFVNLLTNAAKYTDPGGRIWLTVEREISDKQEVVIRVGDNGLGMEAEFLPRAFDLFAQGKEARYRGQGGLGIGLTLVRQIVEAHKGRISAHSKGRGQGSEFVVRLPSGVTERRTAVESPSSGEMMLHAPAGAPRRKVLVVDDNVDAVDALATLLRLWGHDVRVAHDGLAALEVMKEFLPDVILLDLTLPQLDGYEVARRVLQAEWTPKPQLIAVSGNGQDEDYRRCRDSGFDRLMVKPVDPEELERIVRQARTA
jgi:signal transduction histidine kinase/CheY-like chemotaxis protein